MMRKVDLRARVGENMRAHYMGDEGSPPARARPTFGNATTKGDYCAIHRDRRYAREGGRERAGQIFHACLKSAENCFTFHAAGGARPHLERMRDRARTVTLHTSKGYFLFLFLPMLPHGIALHSLKQLRVAYHEIGG